MDSLTQIVLGAAVGEAVLGKKIGNRAFVWGAIAGTIPDLDVITRPFLPMVQGLSWHRGFSHSLIFFILISPVLAWLAGKIHAKRAIPFQQWFWFFFMITFTHALLDCFTSWGTQLFWPHPWRVHFNNIFVADPLYTVPFLMTVLLTLFFKRSNPWRSRINNAGIIISSAYMLLTIAFKGMVFFELREDLQAKGIDYIQLTTRPAPLNTILWIANVELEDEYLLTYRSLLDNEADGIQWVSVKKNWHLLEPYRNNEDLQLLLHLTQGFYVAEDLGEVIQINDLRFGQQGNLGEGGGEFVFKYHLTPQDDGFITFEQIDPPRPSMEEAAPMMEELYKRMLSE
ncbi:MAG: metal-dependent hydrolase [Bacteroidetes bacterium]|nr:metal-dependent hydrolase [Bacteroidota bacterium]